MPKVQQKKSKRARSRSSSSSRSRERSPEPVGSCVVSSTSQDDLLEVSQPRSSRRKKTLKKAKATVLSSTSLDDVVEVEVEEEQPSRKKGSKKEKPKAKPKAKAEPKRKSRSRSRSVEDATIPVPKKAEPVKLGDKEEIEVCDWLQTQPMYFNKKDKDYYNRSKKIAVWGEKAAEYGLNYEQLNRWYQSTRSRLGKLDINKIPSGAPAPEDWTPRDQDIWKRLGFLRPYIFHRTVREKSVSHKPPGDDNDDDDDDDNDDDQDQDQDKSLDAEQPELTPGIEPATKKPKKKKAKKCDKDEDLQIVAVLQDLASRSQTGSAVPARAANRREGIAQYVSGSAPDVHDEDLSDFEADIFQLCKRYRDKAKERRRAAEAQPAVPVIPVCAAVSTATTTASTPKASPETRPRPRSAMAEFNCDWSGVNVPQESLQQVPQQQQQQQQLTQQQQQVTQQQQQQQQYTQQQQQQYSAQQYTQQQQQQQYSAQQQQQYSQQQQQYSVQQPEVPVTYADWRKLPCTGDVMQVSVSNQYTGQEVTFYQPVAAEPESETDDGEDLNDSEESEN